MPGLSFPLRGIIPPVCTPMYEDFSVDTTSLARLLGFLLERGLQTVKRALLPAALPLGWNANAPRPALVMMRVPGVTATCVAMMGTLASGCPSWSLSAATIQPYCQSWSGWQRRPLPLGHMSTRALRITAAVRAWRNALVRVVLALASLERTSRLPMAGAPSMARMPAIASTVSSSVTVKPYGLLVRMPVSLAACEQFLRAPPPRAAAQCRHVRQAIPTQGVGGSNV